MIYFLRAKTSQAVAIGACSNEGLGARLASIQAAMPDLVMVEATAVGAGRGSRVLLHQAFESSHIRGDWFTPTPPLDALIRAVAEGGDFYEANSALPHGAFGRMPREQKNGRPKVSNRAMNRRIKTLGKKARQDRLEEEVANGTVKRSYLPGFEPCQKSDIGPQGP